MNEFRIIYEILAVKHIYVFDFFYNFTESQLILIIKLNAFESFLMR